MKKDFQVPGLGPRVSGSGLQVQVQVQVPTPNLHLLTRTWLPIAETRDLKMCTPANHPVSL